MFGNLPTRGLGTASLVTAGLGPGAVRIEDDADNGGASGKGAGAGGRARHAWGRGLEYYRAKYAAEQAQARTLEMDRRQAEEASQELVLEETRTAADIANLEVELRLLREARARRAILQVGLIEEVERLLALAVEAQLQHNRMRAALIAVLAYFY